MIRFIKFLWDYFIPHFVTEDVTIKWLDYDNFEIICCIDDLREDDCYDGIATARSIVFMDYGFFATVSNFRRV